MVTAPAQRPTAIFVLALFADLAAISYLPFALVRIGAATSPRDLAIGLALAVYAVSRLGASYGLRRLKRFGALLERISAVVWIACAIYAVFAFELEVSAMALPGVAIALGALIYLERPATKALFAGPGLPFNVAAIMSWLAVAVPVSVMTLNVSKANDRQTQSRTMATMKEIASAWEGRAIDFNRYNAAAVVFPTTGITAANLETYLTPTYIKVLPQKDGWGNNWQFGIDQPFASKNAAQVYAIASFGKDGQSEGRWNGGETTHFDCDIVYSNGQFLQYPVR